MSGPALAQVDLDRKVAPFLTLPHREEIDGEAPQHSLVREHPRRPKALFLDLQPVAVIGREAAAEEDLTARAAEHLIVRRDWRELSQRINPELGRRGALDIALDELLYDAAHPGELLLVEVPGHVLRLKGE